MGKQILIIQSDKCITIQNTLGIVLGTDGIKEAESESSTGNYEIKNLFRSFINFIQKLQEDASICFTKKQITGCLIRNNNTESTT